MHLRTLSAAAAIALVLSGSAYAAPSAVSGAGAAAADLGQGVAAKERGPRGPRGKRGKQGPAGPAGPAGAPGPVGTSTAYGSIDGTKPTPVVRASSPNVVRVYRPAGASEGSYCIVFTTPPSAARLQSSVVSGTIGFYNRMAVTGPGDCAGGELGVVLLNPYENLGYARDGDFSFVVP